jgi:calnexin
MPGVWAPREIANPSYFEDLHPFLSIAPMAGIAVEVWTTSAGILFDNFLVARSLSDALAFAKHTFKPKAEAEIAQHKAEQAAQTQRDREESVAKGGFRAYMEVKALEAAEFFNANPYAVFASLLAVGLTFIYLVLFGGKDVKIVRKERKAPAAASQEGAPVVEEEPATDEKDE